MVALDRFFTPIPPHLLSLPVSYRLWRSVIHLGRVAKTVRAEGEIKIPSYQEHSCLKKDTQLLKVHTS